MIFKQNIPVSLQEAWRFFSNPENLKEITPAEMGFDILNGPLPEKIYPGMIIIYTVRPLLNIPMTWVTEITQVEEPGYFIDNQKAGPYAYWHHQHFLKETETGVEVTDIVNFKAPLGVLGRIMEKLVIRKKVDQIFDYRKARLVELFG